MNSRAKRRVLLCVEMGKERWGRWRERGHVYELFSNQTTTDRQTDVLIRLHASLEVRTRDDLCRSIFT